MRFAWLALVCFGCYSAPDYDDTRFKCNAQHGCPDGQVCISGFCTVMSGNGDGGSTMDVAPGGTGVVCGSMTCSTNQKCCADFVNGPSCIALTAGCSGYEATCDGIEDCNGGSCCDTGGSMIGCEASCNTTQQICREDADCTNNNLPKCCFGTGANEPWGRCWNACP